MGRTRGASLSERFLQAGRELAFVFASSAAIVFCSEKTYWYAAGDLNVVGLALFYCPAVLFGLWAIQRYSVRHWEPVYLCGVVFGVLVEGVMTPVMYEGGPFDPIMVLWPSMAWHALLSFLVCWYFFHKWLVNRKTWRLTVAASIYGVFLGAWSLVYALPENAAEAPAVTWAPAEYALWTLWMTCWFAAGHYAMGLLWPCTFRPHNALLIAGVVILLLFSLNWVPALPWAPFKLICVLAWLSCC